jgi:putative ABC transport system permease protein
MWWASVRDMQWRRRRFAIGVVGAAVVFAMALLLSGLSAGFRGEARRIIGGLGGDGWVMDAGASGPITSMSTLPVETADELRATPGVTAAQPVIAVRAAVRATGQEVMLLGGAATGLGAPPVVEGRAATRTGEIVVDKALGARIGETLVLGRQRLRVTGRTTGRTVLAGLPGVFVTVDQAQAIAFGGRPLVTAVLVEGTPRSVPDGTRLIPSADATADALSPMKEPIKAIDMLRTLLWLVAGIIIGSIVYLTALERMRDFAVLKAVGASSRTLGTGLALQAVLLSLVAAALAGVLAQVLIPAFPLSVEISHAAVLALPAVAIGVGLLASLAGLRRVSIADPVSAFASA